MEGTIITDRPSSTEAEQRVLVLFQNGEQVLVPRDLLTQQADGRYRLMASIEELVANQGSLTRAAANEAQTLVVPVTEEKVTVQKRVIEKGRVQIHKTVHEHTEVVDQPLHVEQVEIERVAINRLIDKPVSIRHEGDPTIIPLLE
jgi:stress response protein YsnF